MKIKRVTAVIFILAIVSAFIGVFLVSARNDRNIEIYTDNEGGFYILNDRDSMQCLTITDAKGSRERYVNNNADLAVSGRGMICLMSYVNGETVVICEGRMRETGTFILSDINVRKNCFEIDGEGMIYAVGSSDDKCICIYDNNAVLTGTVKTSSAITSLFYSESADRVFAVTADGLTDAVSGEEILCSVPAGEYSVSGDICTDSRGNVYRFYEQKGFVLLYHSMYDMLCPSKDGVYAGKGSDIFLLDENGEPVKSFEAGNRVEALKGGGNCIAYYAGNKLNILDKSDMKRIEKISAPEESKKPTASSSRESSVQSSEESSKPSVKITGNEKIKLNGRFLFLKESMTVSDFKEILGIRGSDAELYDHKGRQTGSGHIGTGWRLRIPSYSGKEYETVLLGDVTGEGSINNNDVSSLCDYLLGKTNLSDAYLFAADIDENVSIELRDLFILYKSTG